MKKLNEHYIDAASLVIHGVEEFDLDEIIGHLEKIQGQNLSELADSFAKVANIPEIKHLNTIWYPDLGEVTQQHQRATDCHLALVVMQRMKERGKKTIAIHLGKSLPDQIIAEYGQKNLHYGEAETLIWEKKRKIHCNNILKL